VVFIQECSDRGYINCIQYIARRGGENIRFRIRSYFENNYYTGKNKLHMISNISHRGRVADYIKNGK
jgi:hypothetical protein